MNLIWLGALGIIGKYSLVAMCGVAFYSAMSEVNTL